MKIGILTQPLHSNYGGLLQAWALQKILIDMGHRAIIINREYNKAPSKTPVWRKCLSILKNELLIVLGKRHRYLTVTEELRRYSEMNVKKFKDARYRGITSEIKTNNELLEIISKENFDAYVVGSDQVWRPAYSPNLMTYFLDFIKDNHSVKKISYAASFGVDNWEFDEEQTKKAKELAPLFDLITVREASGVGLVEKYLNCRGVHVLDPTMLLNQEEYNALVNNSTCKLRESKGDLFSYVLDSSEEIKTATMKCAEVTRLKPFFCNYSIPVYRLRPEDKTQDCIVPPVEQWLKSFIDAKMVITDSFHGVVFSIIFNKPFWVIVNQNRGATRFMSLLELFNLEKRIIINPSNIDWDAQIDWNYVNKIREEKKLISISLLSNYLK